MIDDDERQLSFACVDFDGRRCTAIDINTAMGLTEPPESALRWAEEMAIEISAAKARLAEKNKTTGKLLAEAISQAGSGQNSNNFSTPAQVPKIDSAEFDFLAPVAATAAASAHASLDALFGAKPAPPTTPARVELDFADLDSFASPMQLPEVAEQGHVELDFADLDALGATQKFEDEFLGLGFNGESDNDDADDALASLRDFKNQRFDASKK